jgi:hypothetical protein
MIAERVYLWLRSREVRGIYAFGRGPVDGWDRPERVGPNRGIAHALAAAKIQVPQSAHQGRTVCV